MKEYSGEDKIVLRQGKYGKLYWKAPPGQRKITFNLSHSGEWVLAIFASRQAVGIDVQEMGEISEYMEIAKISLRKKKRQKFRKQKALNGSISTGQQERRISKRWVSV